MFSVASPVGIFFLEAKHISHASMEANRGVVDDCDKRRF